MTERRPAEPTTDERSATTITHALERGVGRDVVRDRFEHAALDAVGLLGLERVEPEVRDTMHRSSSPEPRDVARITTEVSELCWRNGEHEVRVARDASNWDSWSGIPGGGELFHGVVTLVVDDTSIAAPFGSDGMVTELSERGRRSPAISGLLDELVEGLRSAP